MWIGRQHRANAVLTLCGFLLAGAPICLKRSGFENPERGRSAGAEQEPPGFGYGGTPQGRDPWRDCRGGSVRFSSLPGAELPPSCLPQFQETCGESMAAPYRLAPGVAARGIMAPVSLIAARHVPGRLGTGGTGQRF